MRKSPIEISLPGQPAYRLLHIPGGEYLMGSPNNDPDASDSEKPAHRVHVDDFYMGEFPVTQDLWEAVTRKNQSNFKGARRPVENISWDYVQKVFLPRLIELTGQHFRLPTEAEWEYAARGGPWWESEGYRFAGSDLPDQVAWYDKNSEKQTRDVGLLLPNALGLYDMSGNVWEWCADPWHENYNGAPNDGKIWQGGDESFAILRGGSWNYFDNGCRAARRLRSLRDNNYIDIGVRLARDGVAGGM